MDTGKLFTRVWAWLLILFMAVPPHVISQEQTSAPAFRQ